MQKERLKVLSIKEMERVEGVEKNPEQVKEASFHAERRPPEDPVAGSR